MSKIALSTDKDITPTEVYLELEKALLGDTKAFSGLYFKREDLHPYGSHKGRSIPYMIDEYVKTGARHFVISSSGNAALAAGLYINELNAKQEFKTNPILLEILAGKNINLDKLEKLQALKNDHVLVSMHERPLQVLFIKTKEAGAIPLRQSTDDTALVGYTSLAKELIDIPNLKAVFIGTSSGTTAQALANYFIKNKKQIEIQIVQTSSCHPMVDDFAETKTNEKSIADAIVDQTALRKNALLESIQVTNGSGWVVNNEAIRIAQDVTKKHTGLTISTNSALSVAGLMSAVYTGKQWKGSIACIICGA